MCGIVQNLARLVVARPSVFHVRGENRASIRPERALKEDETWGLDIHIAVALRYTSNENTWL